jgi:hypothetical protein
VRAEVHVLTLSATPIPRTLQLALTGVRELSLITTPPVDRLAVRTFITPFDPLLIREALLRELAERYVELGQHRPSRAEQAQAYRRAAELLTSAGETEDRLVEVLQFLLRVEPSDEAARFQLAATLSQRNRPRDVVRVLEQGLTITDPAPTPESAMRMRAALVEMYADELRELERATPHVDPSTRLPPNGPSPQPSPPIV